MRNRYDCLFCSWAAFDTLIGGTKELNTVIRVKVVGRVNSLLLELKYPFSRHHVVRTSQHIIRSTRSRDVHCARNIYTQFTCTSYIHFTYHITFKQSLILLNINMYKCKPMTMTIIGVM